MPTRCPGALSTACLRRRGAPQAEMEQLVDQLALAILEGTFQPGDAVRVDAAEGELVLTKAAAPVGAASAPAR